MKYLSMLISVLFCICFSSVQAQDEQKEEISVLKAPESWRSELIPFPLSFAPSIDFTGVEDIRFAAGWNQPDSPEFWTYTFVWDIEEDPQLTVGKLHELMKAYYDGIMGVDYTMALFVKSCESNAFFGKVRTHDRFFTKEEITLNIKVFSWFCPKTSHHLVRFDLSPQPVDHSIWEKFKEVEVDMTCQD